MVKLSNSKKDAVDLAITYASGWFNAKGHKI